MAQHELVNRTKSLMIIPLSDGTSVHLAPGKKATVQSYQVEGNAKLTKLKAAGLVEEVGVKENAKAAEKEKGEVEEGEPVKHRDKGKK